LASLDETARVQSIGRGDERAMETLYRTHVDAVFRFIYRRVGGNYEDAEELTQETFLTVLGLAASFEGRSSVFVWLCGIAKLRIGDFYRKRARVKRIPASMLVSLDEALPGAKGVDALERVEASLMVDRLARELSEDEREAFMMRHVEGLSLDEIGELLGKSERAAEGLIYRAKTKLRQAICDWQGAKETP
jgi:RNA polymerase sigma-70 factor (ECF subfamily)